MAARSKWGSVAVGAMPLLPRWRFMTDEAKALTKRVAVSAYPDLEILPA